MKHLPEVDLTYDPLTRILYGAVRSKLLLTAIGLGVFSHLTSSKSAETLARELETHVDNTRLLLDALVANDVLQKKNGKYTNTRLADAFLVKNRPTYLGDELVCLAGYMSPALEDMSSLVINGPSPRGCPMSPLARAAETEISGNYQRAGRAQQAAAIVSGLPEFASLKKMLDLGGGAGLIALAIVAAHPSMSGVVFDRPEVVEVAQRFIRQYELEDRVKVMGGDFMKDSIGDNYDLVWTSSVLGRGNLESLLPKIYMSLAPGGIHVNLGEGLTHERTQPAATINSMLAVCLRSGDSLFEEGEVARAMKRAGFRSVESRAIADPQACGATTVDIARK